MNAPTYHRAATVHLNTAGLGRMSASARAVLTECVRLDDHYGAHELEERVESVVHTEIHQRLGDLLNAPSGSTELFTTGAAAYDAYVSRLPLDRHHRVWTTPYESAAHLGTLHALRERTGCRIEVVPLRPDGDLDLDWMAEHIDDDVALVSVAHVPATRGIVAPVEEIGRLLAPHRCLYAVDAAYSVGQLPVDVRRIGCRLLTGDAWRFLRGPRSVGFAYADPHLRSEQAEADRAEADLVRAVADLGLGEFASDGFTPAPAAPATAAVAAFNESLAQHARTVPAAREDLLSALRAAVEAVEGIELLTPGRAQSAVLAFHHPDLPSALIRRRLAARGVAVWKTVAQETPLLADPLGPATALRVSVHHDNAPEDITRFAEALREVVREERARPARPVGHRLHVV
ncbi:aminotransferase class V-fold PLP-dependent enzyme [Streptomyces sp. NPDC006739]|uniref:aminotransferase class V-fold PLP-dependent enzyme n=1 Tax=Streptomyces sp. NPDC006739 TaxID=3364763 RepID=UPI0036CF16F3